MNHPFTVSTSAAARLLLKAARLSPKAVTLVADVIEGRISLDPTSWDEFGTEGIALAEELSKAIGRSQRARQAARARRSSTAAPEAPVPIETPFEMRRTSRGMEKFYRWPDRSWRRTPPPADPSPELIKRHRKKRS